MGAGLFSSPSGPRAIGRIIAAAFALVLIGPLACSGDEVCEGTEIGGRCEKTCNAALCTVPGSVCFDNACAQPCPNNDTKNECPLGTFCAGLSLDADPSNAEGNFCVMYPFGHSGKIGQNEPCSTDSDCDVHRGYLCDAATKTCLNNEKRYEACTATTECAEGEGYACVDGECRKTGCTTHEDCAVIGECQPGTTDAGVSILACVKGTTYPPGQFGTPCPGGTTGGECDEANSFVCIGNVGQVDSYCTKTGCQADTDCATGYFCSTVRTGRPPCQTACGITGQPAAETCVPPEKLGPGQEYSCGPVSLLRNICLKREFCNECTTDADCLANANQVCAKDATGKKICTQLCDEGTNSCPWGNAATCAVFDQELGKPTCSHRFTNGCVGTGKSCEPCIDDADCPTGLCVDSSFTRERFCIDLSVSCSCAGLTVEDGAYCFGGGCPMTPGSLTMQCYGGPDIPATSIILNKCYGANASANPLSSPQTGCWGPN